MICSQENIRGRIRCKRLSSSFFLLLFFKKKQRIAQHTNIQAVTLRRLKHISFRWHNELQHFDRLLAENIVFKYNLMGVWITETIAFLFLDRSYRSVELFCCYALEVFLEIELEILIFFVINLVLLLTLLINWKASFLPTLCKLNVNPTVHF